MSRLLIVFAFTLPLLTGCFEKDTTAKAPMPSEVTGTPSTKPDTSIRFDTFERPPKSAYKNPKF